MPKNLALKKKRKPIKTKCGQKLTHGLMILIKRETANC